MEEVETSEGVPAAGEEEPEVLHVALTPAAVAFEGIEEGGRAFFVAAFVDGEEPDLMPGLLHEGGLDEIVAEDVAAEGFAAGEFGEGAVFDEGFEADDGVVAPERGVAHGEVVETGHEGFAVGGVGELHDAAEEGFCAEDAGGGLDDAGRRVFLHDADHVSEERAAHDAVGVEDDHVAVAFSPAAAEVGDIARLAIDGFAAFAVEDAAEAVELAAEFEPRELLLDPFVRIVGIGEDEEVEVGELAFLLEGLVDDAETFEDAADVFVVDRHDDGGGGGERGGLVFVGERVEEVEGIGFAADGEADDGGPEARAELVEERGEDREHGDLEPVETVSGEGVAHEPEPGDERDEDGGEERGAAAADAGLGEAFGGGCVR